MHVASGPRDFVDRPSGRYLRLGSLVYWCFDLDLWGVSASGVPSAEDVARFVEVLELEATRISDPPYASLVDFRRITYVEPAAFTAWARHLEQRRQQRGRVRREVVVRPTDGLVASVLAGYAEVLSPVHPVSVEVDPLRALHALGRTDASVVLDAIETIGPASSHQRALDRLRENLVPPWEVHTLDGAARALGVSSRNLQRQLQNVGTTFQAEFLQARLRFAERKLEDADEKVGAIALDAGFATQAHFTKAFTQSAGLSPAAWRAAHRKARS